jgi:hypothetical protein
LLWFQLAVNYSYFVSAAAVTVAVGQIEIVMHGRRVCSGAFPFGLNRVPRLTVQTFLLAIGVPRHAGLARSP